MKIFVKFHLLMNFEKSLNATLIALISKKTKSVEVKDFCPCQSCDYGYGENHFEVTKCFC